MNKWVRAYLNNKDRSIKGCNFSICKQDLLAVNGFDERFDRYSLGEDTDLEARLRRNGVKFLGIRNQAIQYHFYHKKSSIEDNNVDIYNDNNKNGVAYTKYGIKKEGASR